MSEKSAAMLTHAGFDDVPHVHLISVSREPFGVPLRSTFESEILLLINLNSTLGVRPRIHLKFC
jgi:hypothetical protein